MSYIKTELNQHIFTITMDRPKLDNAICNQMYVDMTAAIKAAKESARVIVITGKGCFSSGNDLKDFLAVTEADEVDISQQAAFMDALSNCPIPVIAAVHGVAIGIGVTLLLHCDFVFCTPDTKFQMPFINLGVTPEFGSSYILPRVMGHRLAADLLMLGEMFDVETAYQLGLVNDVEEQGLLMQRVYTVATKLAEKPQETLRKTKALMKVGQEQLSEHIEVELDEFAKCLQSPPAKEAVNAFFNKRAPNFEQFN